MVYTPRVQTPDRYSLIGLPSIVVWGKYTKLIQTVNIVGNFLGQHTRKANFRCTSRKLTWQWKLSVNSRGREIEGPKRKNGKTEPHYIYKAANPLITN